MDITGRLAAFIAQTRYASLPAAAITQARRAVLDTLAVMLAGSQEPAGRLAGDVVRLQDCRPVATAVGQGFRSSAAGAAFVNGVAGHALDFDDFNSSMSGHPSVPLLPVVLAVAEERDANGQDALTAFVVGFEVQARIGRAMGPSHYARGWHATATLGTLGAASAAAVLYQIDADKARMALGIAASLAGGMRQNFGTMSKPLHPGHAAQSGVLAAQLAARGFTADAEIIESPLGFLNLFSPDGDAEPSRVLENLGSRFELVDTGINVKRYPCCYATHRAIDAVLDLVAQHSLQADAVEGVEVSMPRGAGSPLIHPRPQTGLEGKFSMEYCVAAALLDGRVVLGSFTDGAVRRSEAQELLRRVVSRESEDESPPAEGYADVTLILRNGARVHEQVAEARGAPSLPVSWDELVDKFTVCAQGVIDANAARRVPHMVGELEKLESIAGLASLLAGQNAAVIRSA